MVEHESYPMLSPSVEKLSVNVVNGGIELASLIPPSVWTVIIGWYLFRQVIRKNNPKG